MTAPGQVLTSVSMVICYVAQDQPHCPEARSSSTNYCELIRIPVVIRGEFPNVLLFQSSLKLPCKDVLFKLG